MISVQPEIDIVCLKADIGKVDVYVILYFLYSKLTSYQINVEAISLQLHVILTKCFIGDLTFCVDWVSSSLQPCQVQVMLL